MSARKKISARQLAPILAFSLLLAVNDGLHLSVQGYQLWADALIPVFTEVPGPPASEDRAPLPSSNPAARSTR